MDRNHCLHKTASSMTLADGIADVHGPEGTPSLTHTNSAISNRQRKSILIIFDKQLKLEMFNFNSYLATDNGKNLITQIILNCYSKLLEEVLNKCSIYVIDCPLMLSRTIYYLLFILRLTDCYQCYPSKVIYNCLILTVN